MSTELLGLRTVIYPAPDLEAAKRWWTEFLGFEPYFDEPFYVGFDPGGYELGLLPDADPAEGALTYWGVDDVNGAVDAALEAGATLDAEPTDVGEGIITASVRTPDGSIVGFIYNPHFMVDDDEEPGEEPG
ncbi:MAG: VOC family protein [Acidimicrobiales bacterium]|jgi:catechol 2,3-dioxygenase-like lactoylglutathione lyase family enzyme